MKFFGLLLLLFCASNSLAQQDDSGIARILASASASGIRSVDGERRSAGRREEVFVGERLETGSDGGLTVRFTDDSLLVLACDSAVEIHEFRFDGADGGVARIELLYGELRLIPGKVVEGSYEVAARSAAARLAAADSDIGIAIRDSGEVIVAAFTGSSLVVADGGALGLGVGHAQDFLSVADEGAPTGLSDLPAVVFTGQCMSVSFE